MRLFAHRLTSVPIQKLAAISILGAAASAPGAVEAQGLRPFAAAADSFLGTLASKGPAASWQMASPQFRTKLSIDRWGRYARASGLIHFRSAKWTSMSPKGDVTFLLGSVTMVPGGTVPARLEFVKDGPAWKVLFVDLKLSGAAYQAVRQPGVATNFH